MDYLIRQFIAAINRLRSEVRILGEHIFYLRQTIDKQSDAHKSRNSKDQNGNAHPILRAELQVPYPIEVRTEPKDKRTGRGKYKLVIETLTLLVVIGYTTAAYFQERDAKNGNKISGEALISVQRAFLICDRILPQRLAQIKGNNRVENWLFTMPCVNNGNTPANAISQAFSTAFFARQDDAKEPTEKCPMYSPSPYAERPA